MQVGREGAGRQPRYAAATRSPAFVTRHVCAPRLLDACVPVHGGAAGRVRFVFCAPLLEVDLAARRAVFGVGPDKDGAGGKQVRKRGRWSQPSGGASGLG